MLCEIYWLYNLKTLISPRSTKNYSQETFFVKLSKTFNYNIQPTQRLNG